MARRGAAYKSDKRKKELKRQKKREEKLLRKQGKLRPEEDSPEAGAADEPEVSGETSDVQEQNSD